MESRRDLTWEDAREATLYSESIGFEYNLIAARWYGPVLECYSTTAALASITRTQRLIIAIHSGLVQPQVVAKIGANIDQITNGRFHINLVSGAEDQGFQQRDYGGIWLPHDERYELSDEYIRIIKGIWTNQPYSYTGKYYNINNVDMLPKPVQEPYPTIFLGGKSEPARELAAKECDWYITGGMTIEDAMELRADVEKRAARHGRKVRFAISGMIMLRDTDEEAAREFEELQARAETDRTVRTHAAGLRYGMWGRPERVAERIAEFSRLGFEMALLQGRSLMNDLRQFNAEVVPLLPKASNGQDSPSAQYLTVA
jgi:FMNH2-dependent dimethyl sulfone monooxygenase